MAKISNIVLFAAIMSGVSGMAHADVRATSSTSVNAGFSVSEPGTISASWVGETNISSNSPIGSSIGTLHISFSGGNTIVIKEAVGAGVKGVFGWASENGSGKILAKAYYKNSPLDMNASGEAIIRNLDKNKDIDVGFRKFGTVGDVSAGKYSETLLVNVYTM
ncbi:CD15/CS22/SEF14 family fimbrial major subunit [Serratia liquefaciens]|uniref:CD15/CS22/SEF14 family fimbrial major subunit n=1 Tax=Serratia liquefaciens TaxID=614 RepID=UPI003807B0C6